MSNNLYNFTLKTLSPIHIDDGKSYTPAEFVYSKAKFHGKNVKKTIKRIDLVKFYMSLNDDEKDKFLEDLTNPNFKLKSKDLKNRGKCLRYDCLDMTKTREKDIPIKEIHEHVKTSDKLYIPGSSIKGSIKTAIFYNLVNKNDIYRIQNILKNGYIIKREYNRFVDSYFSAPRGNSAQKSIFRFMQIPDTNNIINIPRIYESWTVMATPDVRKHEFYSVKGNKVRTFLEAIPKNKVFNSSINITYDSKFYKSLDVDDKKDILNIDNIKTSIFKFSRDLIEYEWDFADEYDIDYLYKFYKKISKLNTEDTPLLRIGSGSGLMGTTILMKIKEYDYERFSDIQKTFKKQYDYEFPKSRKITSQGEPFGWTQLNFK